MIDRRISNSLSNLAAFLAGIGALLLTASVGFSALLLWHRVVAGGGATYVLAPLWLPIAFASCSALVVVGFAALRRKVGHLESSARRFANAAMLLTVAAWVICGIAWVAAGS